MAWIEISFIQPSVSLPATEALLEEMGAVSISLQDAHDQPIYEPLPYEVPLWEMVMVKALFERSANGEGIVSALSKHPGIDDLRHSVIEDQDWIRNWMDRYEPIHIGHNLWICPSWIEPPDSDAINLILDPGLAFGSGTHPTTALCLEWLAQQPPVGLEILDFGCGSGILAVASLKLGARHVTATDIDPQALLATDTNAQQNAISPSSIDTLLSTAYSATPVDLVLANILSGTLIDLAELISSCCKPGGQILLSGILEKQVDQVINAYTPWFDFNPAIVKQDWVLLHGRHKVYLETDEQP